MELGSLDLIKGRGGALLREKIVASSSRQLIIVVDESKIVNRLGSHGEVPVEIVSFGWQSTAHRLEKLGVETSVAFGSWRGAVCDRWRSLHCGLLV